MTRGPQQVYKNQNLQKGHSRSPVLPSRNTCSLSRPVDRTTWLPASPWVSVSLSQKFPFSVSPYILPFPLHLFCLCVFFDSYSFRLTHTLSLFPSISPTSLSGKNICFQVWLWQSKKCHLYYRPIYRNVQNDFVYDKNTFIVEVKASCI